MFCIKVKHLKSWSQLVYFVIYALSNVNPLCKGSEVHPVWGKSAF